jgi:hypothetical protein
MSGEAMMFRLFPNRFIHSILAAALTLILLTSAEASVIDPANKWAWGASIGWINFSPTGGDVTVCADHLEGYAWAENTGWIHLGTVTGCAAHTYSNASAADYGVNLDNSGKLTGSAWSASAGWIRFDPTNGGVTIDPATGSFDGFAWGENVGWIHFKGPASNPYNVVERFIKLFVPVGGRTFSFQ